MPTRTPTSQELYAPTYELLASLLGNSTDNTVDAVTGAAPVAAPPEVLPSTEDLLGRLSADFSRSVGGNRPSTYQPVYPVPEGTEIVTTPPTKSRLDTLNELAQQRGAGTVWTRDANGNLVASNTPETRAKGTLGYSPSSASSASTGVMGSFDQQMADIEAMPADQRIKGLIDLQGTVSMFASQRREQARGKAEAELGVSNLKQMLEASMQDDRRYPQFQRTGTYSQETEALRNNYQAALSQAQGRTSALLAEDSELLAVVKKTELFSTFQEKEASLAQSRAAKVTEMADGIREIASWVQGRPATDTDLLKNYNKFAAYEALSNNPAALLEQTVVNKDPGAATILAHRQTEAVSKTSDEDSPVYQKVYEKTKQEIAIMSGIMSDNSLFESQYLASFPQTVEEQKKAKASLLLLRQSPKEYELVRKQVAQGFIQQGAQGDFEENVGGWVMASADSQLLINPFGIEGTPLNTAYKNASQGVKKVSLQSLVASIKALPPQQATLALEDLKAAMGNAYEHSSGGLYGRAGDALDMEMLLNKKIVQTTAYDRFTKTVAEDTLTGVGIGAGIGVLPGFLTGGTTVVGGAGLGGGVGAVVGTVHGLVNLADEKEGAQ